MPLFLNDKSSASHSFPASAREDTRRRAREESSEGGEKKKKKKTRKTISITQEKESLVGVI